MAKLTPIKAIRAKCIDCCCGQRQEVRLCAVTGCPLHEYRMGKRPKNREEASDFSDFQTEGETLTGDNESK
ncbi:hypothetical protein LI291_10665 [Intestinibacillus massiliensis]|nr:hypothetical protein [Intestinibacillus massiliensis]